MYAKLGDLPEAVKVLPEHGQEIWMAAFNPAMEQYNDEEKAFATAWAAVKNKYEKKGGEWVAIEDAKMIPLVILKEIASDAPGEFQLLPYGKIEIEGEGPAFVDEESARLILDYQSRRGNDMVIDYEHQTLKDVEAPAAGWIKKMANKGRDGIWAAVEWTKRAKDYLVNKEYRFFSPVILIRPSDRKVVAVVNVALTNFPKINNLRPIIAKLKADDDESERAKAKEVQETRSKKYGIAIKEGGHVTKPSEWDHVDDDEFLDPVNYRYPCPDADQTRAAAAYWGRPDNQEQYSSEERSIINKRLDRFKEKFKIGESSERKEAKVMLEKLKKLLGLANDAGEEKVVEAVTVLVNKTKIEPVACKEILEVIGAKENSKKEEVLQIIAGLKAPADVAKTLSLEVASLRKDLFEIKQNDLIQLALKEGKTSPEELDKWGRDLALKNAEQFKVIVLSRPAGSVIPIDSIHVDRRDRDPGMDEVQKQINKMMGISDETFKKYNRV